MKIQNAQISLASQREATTYYRQQESMQVTQGNNDGQTATTSLEYSRSTEYTNVSTETYAHLAEGKQAQALQRSPQAILALATRANPQAQFNFLSKLATPELPTPLAIPESTSEDPESDSGYEEYLGDGQLSLLKSLIEQLTGEEIEILEIEDAPELTEDLQSIDESINPIATPEDTFGFSYSFSEFYQEIEITSFSASGTINTDDGQAIEIDLALEMSYFYSASTEINISAGTEKTDPLVINFNNSMAELTETKFSFDLNADGYSESISFTSQNSAFLAIDLNLDGSINDGNELFGAKTGNGFAELAEYDDDGNGFIDEGDGLFDRLLAYNKSLNGEDQITPLSDIGVGAIYLGSETSNFNIKTAENELLGSVRESGIYLNEDGSAGTVQQIDLVV